MRILLFIQSLELGGSEKQCVEMARLLSKNGFAVTVGCMRRTGPLRRNIAEAGLPLVEFPVRSLLRPGALSQMLRLVRFIRANKFGVVQANDLYANLFAVPAARIAGTPVIISSQRDLSDGVWYTPLRRKLLRSIQHMATYVMVNSAAIRSQLIEEDHFDSNKIQVVYNGIDVSAYGTTDHNSVRSSLGQAIASTDKLVVMVANMHRDVKGHQDLIAAARIVCRQNPGVRFLLIGNGVMRRTFEAQARIAGLEKSVLFLGHRTDVTDILPCCDIGILASRAEGLPNAVMEYMAAGLATIATEVGGVPELITHERNGLLVPPSDHEALARETLRLLNNEPFRRKLGQAGHNTIRERYDFAAVLSRLKQLYQPPSRWDQFSNYQKAPAIDGSPTS